MTNQENKINSYAFKVILEENKKAAKENIAIVINDDDSFCVFGSELAILRIYHSAVAIYAAGNYGTVSYSKQLDKFYVRVTSDAKSIEHLKASKIAYDLEV